MSLDLALWVAGLCLEVVLAGLLLFRRTQRQLPVFFAYILWDIASDVAGMIVRYRWFRYYLPAFLVESTVDSLFQFVVLVELGWSLLRPARAVFIRPAVAVLVSVVLLTGLFALPSAGSARYSGMQAEWQMLLGSQQFFSILRVLLCVVIAGCTQLLALGFRHRELQIATGFGFYALATLGVSFLHAQPFSRHYWHAVDQGMAASYLACLGFWIANFAKREFPEQQSDATPSRLLAVIARTAHADRLALQTGCSAEGEGSDSENM